MKGDGMDAFLNALNMFFTTFKAAVFVPVFIFVIALAMGVKPKKAFFSALSAGVGLEGFSLVIGSYSPILSPIIDNMINAVGINLPIVDLGWQTTSIIAYSYQVGMIYIAVAIALQVILYLVHYGLPGRRPLEQLFLLRMGLLPVRSDRQLLARHGLHGCPAALHPALHRGYR